MRRRDVIFGMTAAPFCFCAQEALGQTIPDEIEMRKAIRSKFPYRVVETSGRDALKLWAELKQPGVTPVVIGGDDDFDRVAEQAVGFEGDPFPKQSPEMLLSAAAALEAMPSVAAMMKAWEDGILASQTPEEAELTKKFDEKIAAVLGVHTGPKIGEWPSQAPRNEGLSVATDVLSQKPFDKVYIALLPTAENAAAPAWLKWGNWNGCPPPDYHVAVVRRWREKYGAEIVGMSGDVLNLRVSRLPKTRGYGFSA